jgi:hypothetical protein
MAAIRSTERKDGSVAYRVFFRHEGRQTCYTFDSPGVAETFKTAVDQLGSAAAIALHRVERAPRSDTTVTVTEWVKGHIDHLSGAQADTITKYRAYLDNDIAPALGHIPLSDLTDRDVSRWIAGMTGSSKTIGNKQRFLSAALTEAVKAKLITVNPAAGARVPRGEKQQMVFLTHEEFTILLAEITEPWRPLVEFLVVSGCRWGEASALRPADVNRRDTPSASPAPGSTTHPPATPSAPPKPTSQSAPSTSPPHSSSGSTTPTNTCSPTAPAARYATTASPPRLAPRRPTRPSRNPQDTTHPRPTPHLRVLAHRRRHPTTRHPAAARPRKHPNHRGPLRRTSTGAAHKQRPTSWPHY